MIDPAPPLADTGLPWDVPMADPVAALAEARQRHGDTFAVRSGADTYLFLFSPEGVRSFYELPESAASKGIADWSMLRRKLPDELFAGRRTYPQDLFGRSDVRSYLEALDHALDVTIGELGAAGEFDAFALARRIAHRMGLACWAGMESASGDRFEELVVALDALDASDAFVRPDLMAAVAASGKAAERDALAAAEALVGATLRERHERGPVGDGVADLLDRIVERWDGEPDATTGIARDVVLAHLASMSNLYAALAWSLVDLVAQPELLTAVADGDAALAERCALESVRLAQRSIMLRMVLEPVVIDDGVTTMTVAPGTFVATLLPLTNTTAAPGLGRWDPDRWARRQLREVADLPARELVTTFGHGPHTCPAQSFSLAAIVRTLTRLGAELALEPRYEEVGHLPAQIGGVARADRSCLIAYHRTEPPRN